VGGNTPYRIAYSADGNCFATDDLHASPMTLALIHAAKKQSYFAHMDINDNLSCNTPAQAATHIANVATVAKMYGYDQSVIFDDVTQLDAAVAHLTQLINAASSQQRLYILGAGPMEVPWRAINASDPSKRSFVTLISHSGWNDQFSSGAAIHKFKDVQALGVVTNHIENQNGYAFGPGNDWHWLQSYPDGGATLFKIATGDVSDSGMTYYLLGDVSSGATGTSQPTMADVQKFFGL
jgi:hypothetical protein